MNPYELCRIADLGDVRFSSRYDLKAQVDDITRYYGKVHAAGIIPVSAGGDHFITYPILKGIASDRPVGMVHIDAHCDTSGEAEGSRFHHGGPFRQAVLDGVLDPARTIQIGIRGGGEYLWEFSFETGMTVIHAEEIDSLGMDAVIARARAVVGELPCYVSFDVDGIEYSEKSGMRIVFMEEFARVGVERIIEEARRGVGDGPTYITFDVDGLDPVYTPGTGTPEVGGISTIDAQRLLYGLRGLDLVGGDVVEVCLLYTSDAADE